MPDSGLLYLICTIFYEEASVISRNYFLGKSFEDRARFPYGIARSGDFSIAEARFLEQNGALYKALFEGKIEDPSESDYRMIQIYKGELEAETFEEKTWLKYMRYKGRSQIWLVERPKSGKAKDDAEEIIDDEDGDFEELIDDDLEL